MPHYRDDHERLLGLVAEQRWAAFSSEDEGLLRAFVYAGFMLAKPVAGEPGKTRLLLTRRGELYLLELSSRDRDCYEAPPAVHNQRDTDPLPFTQHRAAMAQAQGNP